MPRITPEKCAQGGYANQSRRRRVRLPYDDYPPLPTPDQSRYGPPGTTDSPRFYADGVTPRPPDPPKGDKKR